MKNSFILKIAVLALTITASAQASENSKLSSSPKEGFSLLLPNGCIMDVTPGELDGKEVSIVTYKKNDTSVRIVRAVMSSGSPYPNSSLGKAVAPVEISKNGQEPTKVSAEDFNQVPNSPFTAGSSFFNEEHSK